MNSHMSSCLTEMDFQDYYDQKLSLPERTRLERHLKECPNCAREFRSSMSLFQTLSSSLAPSAVDTPRSAHIESVMNRLSRLEERNPRHWSLPEWFAGFSLKFATVAGLVAVFFFLGVFLKRPWSLVKPGEVVPEKPVFHCSYLLLPESSELISLDRSGGRLPASGSLEAEVQYRLPSPGQAVLAFLGESRLEFSRQAHFQVLTGGISLASGRTFLSIKKPGQPFVVTTPLGTVTCLGTRFGVDVSPLSVRVILEQGKILLKTKVMEETLTDPGERFMTPDGRIMKGNGKVPVPGRKTVPSIPSSDSLPTETGSGSDSLSHAY